MQTSIIIRQVRSADGEKGVKLNLTNEFSPSVDSCCHSKTLLYGKDSEQWCYIYAYDNPPFKKKPLIQFPEGKDPFAWLRRQYGSKFLQRRFVKADKSDASKPSDDARPDSGTTSESQSEDHSETSSDDSQAAPEQVKTPTKRSRSSSLGNLFSLLPRAKRKLSRGSKGAALSPPAPVVSPPTPPKQD